jgi:hypothetical protein
MDEALDAGEASAPSDMLGALDKPLDAFIAGVLSGVMLACGQGSQDGLDDACENGARGRKMARALLVARDEQLLSRAREALGRLREDLGCPICFGVLQSPVGLRCGHSFCRGCCVTWMRATPRRSCPVCRSPTGVETVAMLKENLVLRDLLHKLGLHSKEAVETEVAAAASEEAAHAQGLPHVAVPRQALLREMRSAASSRAVLLGMREMLPEPPTPMTQEARWVGHQARLAMVMHRERARQFDLAQQRELERERERELEQLESELARAVTHGSAALRDAQPLAHERAALRARRARLVLDHTRDTRYVTAPVPPPPPSYPPPPAGPPPASSGGVAHRGVSASGGRYSSLLAEIRNITRRRQRMQPASTRNDEPARISHLSAIVAAARERTSRVGRAEEAPR